MKYELITIDAEKIIETAAKGIETIPTIQLNDENVLHRETHKNNAFLDQLKGLLHEKYSINNFAEDSLLKIWIYVDFNSIKNLNGIYREYFDNIFNEGFKVVFADGEEPIHFVPQLSSASKSRESVFGFIREDLFFEMRNRLDLEFPLEKQIEERTLSHVSKLYSYRGLYTSDTESALCFEDVKESFFNEKNIVIIPEIKSRKAINVKVYTALQKEENGKSSQIKNQVKLEKPIDTVKNMKLTIFDGEGIISPYGCELINKFLPKSLNGKSFQVRMPYFKGVLHTVDFHDFLRANGVVGDCAIIKDYFGVERNLFEANIIVTPSVFKLINLLTDKQRKEKNVMTIYFDMIKKYNHGLYVIKTEAAFHNTQFAHLDYQKLSTLNLSDDDLDGLIEDHKKYADEYCVENLLDPAKREELLKKAERDDWMELLLKQPAFLRDNRIKEMIENYRISKYNDIFFGRLSITGENRFLSNDLIYYMVELFSRITNKKECVKKESDKLIKTLVNQCICRGKVYIPNASRKTDRVGLLRSPHYSRNEDVCVNVLKEEYSELHKHYLGELNGVVFVGYDSFIPAALGGADYDGDQVTIVYDERVIKACGSGYFENEIIDNESLESSKALPFVSIPTLTSNDTAVKKSPYVIPRVVYNSFSSRIGQISNASMKVAAVEYDSLIEKSDIPLSAAFGTILSGTEIDACKKGLRPVIDDVLKYSGSEDKAHKEIVENVETYISLKDKIKGRKYKPTLEYDKNGRLKVKGLDVSIFENRGHNAVTQLLYRWAKSFEDFKKDDEIICDGNLPQLCEIFNPNNPNKEEVDAIFDAYDKAVNQFKRVKKAWDKIFKVLYNSDDKIYTRLKGQYDDIDLYIDGASYRQKLQKLQKDILSVAFKYNKQKCDDLCDALYSNVGKTIDAQTFWPYGNSLSDNDIFNEIKNLENFDLLNNFNFEGYRLLFYILNNLPDDKLVKNTRIVKRRKNNEYLHKYDQYAIKCLSDNSTEKLFKTNLTKMLMADLVEVLHCDEKAEIIRNIYPPKKTNVFWEVFTVRDVLNVLGGVDNA